MSDRYNDVDAIKDHFILYELNIWRLAFYHTQKYNLVSKLNNQRKEK